MHVMHVISGLTNGGAEAVLFRLVTRDTTDTHCVVSMMDGGYYGERLRAHGIDVVELGMPPGRLSLAGLKLLFRVMHKRQPDVVQTWMYHADLIGGIIARLATRARVVWGIHHTTHDTKEDSLTKRLITRACALASGIVPHRIISCSLEGVRVHEGHGYRRGALVAVHNGYDLLEYSPSADDRTHQRKALGAATSTSLIGMIGRFNPQKDHENLLQALAFLKAHRDTGWHCFLVGPEVDDDNAALVKSCHVKGLDPYVTLYGPTDDVPAFMNALDVHVLSSAFGEACPNVIAEAMACGTPCVTTDVGDAALMVGETGWVVPPRNPESLGEALQTALAAIEDPVELAARQQSAMLRVRQRLSLERMLSNYRAVWREEEPLELTDLTRGS